MILQMALFFINDLNFFQSFENIFAFHFQIDS